MFSPIEGWYFPEACINSGVAEPHAELWRGGPDQKRWILSQKEGGSVCS